MKDGYVKEPAVATRANFNPKSMSKDALEELKLEDGVRVHESAKVDLDVYAQQNGVRRVKPFMLVIAENTDHASELVKLIEGERSSPAATRAASSRSTPARRAQRRTRTSSACSPSSAPDEPTEIVVHVNMLKEGWDVTNLYTIVPLRTADSRTLVEQSIGRGLRLPYGKRTGVAAVDRLTIVAHDRFPGHRR
jgi:type III restriction enzyme